MRNRGIPVGSVAKQNNIHNTSTAQKTLPLVGTWRRNCKLCSSLTKLFPLPKLLRCSRGIDDFVLERLHNLYPAEIINQKYKHKNVNECEKLHRKIFFGHTTYEYKKNFSPIVSGFSSKY